VAVHRTAFSRAHNIALVISDSYAHGITYPMFGWRQGMVQPRGFYIRGECRNRSPESGHGKDEVGKESTIQATESRGCSVSV
jgi:hypothetical protein